jgi:site-specific recombinase XerD
MLDEIKDFLEHLKYDHGYSDKTLDSYGRDIEQFYRIIFKHGVDITDVDNSKIIRNGSGDINLLKDFKRFLI